MNILVMGTLETRATVVDSISFQRKGDVTVCGSMVLLEYSVET